LKFEADLDELRPALNAFTGTFGDGFTASKTCQPQVPETLMARQASSGRD
jgi:hypothetical protein